MAEDISTLAPGTRDALEDRVARLEAHLSTSPDWRPEPGDVAGEGLFDPFRRPDGSMGREHNATGDALTDLSSGALHPTSWAQMVTCLRLLAHSVDQCVDLHDDGMSPHGR